MLTAISKDNDVGATIASGTANEVVTPSCARSMHMLVNYDQILQNIRMLNKSVRLQQENIHFFEYCGQTHKFKRYCCKFHAFFVMIRL